eukprot:1157754-Pelagomonas_calceolata.AAC.4
MGNMTSFLCVDNPMILDDWYGNVKSQRSPSRPEVCRDFESPSKGTLVQVGLHLHAGILLCKQDFLTHVL